MIEMVNRNDMAEYIDDTVGYSDRESRIQMRLWDARIIAEEVERLLGSERFRASKLSPEDIVYSGSYIPEKLRR
jgi:hypothetical protein